MLIGARYFSGVINGARVGLALCDSIEYLACEWGKKNNTSRRVFAELEAIRGALSPDPARTSPTLCEIREGSLATTMYRGAKPGESGDSDMAYAAYYAACAMESGEARSAQFVGFAFRCAMMPLPFREQRASMRLAYCADIARGVLPPSKFATVFNRGSDRNIYLPCVEQ